MKIFLKMKYINARIIFIILSLILVSACGGGGGGGGGSSSNDTTATPASAKSTPAEASSSSNNDSNDSTSSSGGVLGSNPPEDEIDPSKISARLSWIAPIERENGDPMVPSELSGYVIRYRIQGELDYTNININDPSATELIIDNMEPGQYEYSIASIDSNGIYGEYSDAQYVLLTV